MTLAEMFLIIPVVTHFLKNEASRNHYRIRVDRTFRLAQTHPPIHPSNLCLNGRKNGWASRWYYIRTVVNHS